MSEKKNKHELMTDTDKEDREGSTMLFNIVGASGLSFYSVGGVNGEVAYKWIFTVHSSIAVKVDNIQQR